MLQFRDSMKKIYKEWSLFTFTKYSYVQSHYSYKWFEILYVSASVLWEEYLNCEFLIEDIKDNAWVTVNKDFWSRVRWFANDFREWQSNEWKSLANHLMRD